nr:MAG TPA: hypothetical protein [Caudoviricetes sp.]
MAKHLCCSAFGKIYYANVNDKGIITGQKIDLTEDAIVAVADKLSWLAVTKEQFDGKAEIEINGFKLIFDGTGNSSFMEKYKGDKNDN